MVFTFESIAQASLSISDLALCLDSTPTYNNLISLDDTPDYWQELVGTLANLGWNMR